MEKPTSASNDNFHNFLCYASDNLPGIVIPQKVYLVYSPHQEAKDPHHVATFYKHLIAGVIVSDRPGATLGVSLAEAFDFDPKVMKWTKDTHVPSLEAVGKLSLKFALKWPGCEGFISDATLYRPKAFWTAARLAHEVACAVHKFYETEVYERHIDTSSPAPDWSPARIPFDRLYLLEVRQVCPHVLQPVLCYAAN